MARAFNLEYEMEREILEAAQKTANRFSADYDHKNLTDRQNTQLKAAITQAAQKQGQLLQELASIAATLHKLANQL